MKAFRADSLFDGVAIHGAATVLVEGARIVAVLDAGEVPNGAELVELPRGTMLAPGYIDLQVNGGGGALFNNAIDVDCIRAIAAAHGRAGTTSLLPTLISGTPREITQALAAGRRAAGEVPGVFGLHIEGPFIALARRGIHPAANLRRLTEADARELCEAGIGCLLTLAPEHASARLIGMLAAHGVRVFGGHSDATGAQTQAGLRAGVAGFTHLFNAMSQFASRAPGVVGAALADRAAFAGIIVDGLHVDPVSVAAAFAAMGPGRLFLVSDAMATAASLARAFVLNGATITLAGGKLTDDAGTLAGAHLTMAEAVRNAVGMAGLAVADALRMATATPADAMGARDRGRIVPGLRADFVALDARLEVIGVWSGASPLLEGERRDQ